ncbi:replication factor A3 [Schistosoma bovis]|uniref:Replication factor A3 n=1 Tax=Schistosoma bovis TaxID=6184 RepID=A0A430QLQ5_SCHBO|nr:replication factor A3 [Schistosoma bovis]
MLFRQRSESLSILRLCWFAIRNLTAHSSSSLQQDSSDQKPTARFRVTGSMLPNLVGRDVCIVGTALRVAPSGQRIHIRCADGREIDCNLLSPLQASPENRVIEVQGRVSNVQGTEINATAEPVVFSQEASTKFDSDLYSQAIQMTAQFDQFYIQPMEA